MVDAPQPFAAVLEPDPGHLGALRLGVASWLDAVEIDGAAREDVVLAAHEGAASAMTSPGDVTVDIAIERDVITVTVTSGDGWNSPDDDVEGHRMRLLRECMTSVSFESLFGRSSLRLARALQR